MINNEIKLKIKKRKIQKLKNIYNDTWTHRYIDRYIYRYKDRYQ
jgi:hypothetical protein